MGVYKASMLHVRIKRGNTVDCLCVATKKFKKQDNYYSYNGVYVCDWFEFKENVGGDIFVVTHTKFRETDTWIENEITIPRGTVEEMSMKTII